MVDLVFTSSCFLYLKYLRFWYLIWEYKLLKKHIAIRVHLNSSQCQFISDAKSPTFKLIAILKWSMEYESLQNSINSVCFPLFILVNIWKCVYIIFPPAKLQTLFLNLTTKQHSRNAFSIAKLKIIQKKY